MSSATPPTDPEGDLLEYESTRTQAERDEPTFECPKYTLEQLCLEGLGECPERSNQVSKDKSLFPYLDVTGLDEAAQIDLEDKLVYETQEIKLAFANFILNVVRSLEYLQIPLEKIKLSVFSLEAFTDDIGVKVLDEKDRQEIKAAKNLSEVFTVLLKYISFFNYHIIKHIIYQHGATRDHTWLEEYLEKFREFCKRSIFELPQDAFSSKSRKTARIFAFKCTEGVSNMQSVEKVTGDIARIFHLRASALQLCSIKKGCVELQFLISASVADHISTVSSSQHSALSEKGVTSCEFKVVGQTIQREEDKYKQQEGIQGALPNFTHDVMVSQQDDVEDQLSPVPLSSHAPLPSQAPPPYTPLSSQAPLPSQAPPPYESHTPPLSRLGILVEATQPFGVNDPVPGQMIKKLFERRGDFDEVKEVMVSQDRKTALVELIHPEVIPQLLSECGNLRDPYSRHPLYASQIDLMTELSPLMDEQIMKQHFETLANSQQVYSVHITVDKQKAMVMSSHSKTAVGNSSSSQTQLFGSDLQLELSPSSAKPALQSSTTDDDGTNVLCVQGLPESMLNDPSLVSAALKLFIKQSSGFEPTHCEIVNGVGYLTFADSSAAQAIVADPPKTTFMAGSALYMSLASPAQYNPPEAPHAEGDPPKEAWGPPAGGQIPGSVSPNRERPSTAPIKQSDRPPVAPRRRYLSDDKADEQLHTHSGDQAFMDMDEGQSQWNNSPNWFPQQQSPQSSLGQMSYSASSPGGLGYAGDQAFGTTGGGYNQSSIDPSKFQQQQNPPQSSFGQMPHSASSPEGLGHGQSQFGQQLPVPGNRYPPQQSRHAPQHRQTQSANYLLPGHNQPMQLGDSWHGSEAQSMFQPGQQTPYMERSLQKETRGPSVRGQLPGSVSPNRERPSTAPVRQLNRPPLAARRRHMSDDQADEFLYPLCEDQTFGSTDWGQTQWNQFPQQQSPQSSFVQMPHSASSPEGLGHGQSQFRQQLPVPGHRYPPQQSRHAPQHRQTQSANYPLPGHNQPMQLGDSWHGSEAQSMFQQAAGIHTAEHPPTDLVFGVPTTTSQTGFCRKVLVYNLPNSEAKNTAALRYYLLGLAGHTNDVSVTIHKNCAVATFNNPINLEALSQQSKQSPFEGAMLTLSPLMPSDKIIVSGLNDGISETLMKLGLSHHAGELECVKAVERISPSQAMVTFKSPESAQKVLSKSQLDLDGHPLITKEYYDFMDTTETDFTPQQSGQPPAAKAAQHAWCAQKEQLTREQLFYLQQSLSELNDKLLPLKACAEIESKCLVISPLKDAGAIDNWEDQVTTVHKEHLEGLCTEIVSFPKEARLDVQDFVLDRSDSILLVKREKQSITIAGQKDVIAEACKKIAELCLEHQITEREIDLQQKYIKYLERFCHQEFKKLGHVVCDLQFKPDIKKVIVKAYPNGHSEVDKIIGRASEASEKNVSLSYPAFKLLSSQRGTEKLKEIFTISFSQLVCDLEQYQDSNGDTQYRICFLSNNKEVLKDVMQTVQLYVHEETFQTTASKIRVCSSKEWRDFVADIYEQHFVAITADETSSTITVTGELVFCPDIVERIRNFLAKHTNIEERLIVGQSEWCIISSNFSNEMNRINEQAKKKQVKVEWPERINEPSLSVVISGEPGVVDDIKVQLKLLVAKVCKKEARITGVPAVVHVLESMEDKIRLLETDAKVRVEINLENSDNCTATAIQSVGEVPHQVCSGTSPIGCQVSVYTGDCTQNAPVGVIVNFITPDPNPQMGHLKHLLESGGLEATEDFRRKISQFIELKPGNVFKTRVGQLRCSQLVHCVLPSWKSSSESDSYKQFYLQAALTQVMQDASMSGSMLLMPLTSAPLHYPVNLFARLVMDAVTYQATSPNLHISVYVEELQHAKEFEGALQTRDFQVHTKVPLDSPLLSAGRKAQETASPTTASAKTITSNLSSFITVVNGDLLQQQADVYINSTNTNLNLKQGQLSKLLLNACGDDLQKECSEYAPLKPGKVAVTDAKNLKCSHIFHVALPEYQTANSERLFRETVKQILCIGKNMSVSSIAIPSLGLANLGFPANISARILFQEVIAFHAQYPNSIQKFVFVIYEKTVFQAFSKEFADQMSGGSQPQVSQDPTPAKGYASAPQPAGSTLLSIVQGNIAEERSDIIVNTTTEDMMLNKSAVSKAIAEKAGEELQKTCRQLFENGMRLEHGQIVLTPAPGKLHCKKLIHAHVPHRGSMAKSSSHHYQLIDKIVTDCLQKAESSQMQSISFPAFGLGGGGYAVDQVAEPMLKAFKKFGQTHPQSVKSIRVVIYDQDLYKLFNEFYCKFFGRSSADPPPPQSIFSRILGSSQKPDNSQELQTSALAPVRRTSGAPPLWVLSRSVPNSVVVFQIFAASDAQCNRIEQQLRDLICEKSTSKEIEDNEVIEHLLEDDFRDIVQIGDQLGVQVRVFPRIKQIRISGEKSKVTEAYSDIQRILHDVEKSKTELISFEWQSEDDDGMYEPYPPEANIWIERAHGRGAKAVELIIDGVAVIIDLQYQTETDKTTGKRRNLRRVKKTMSSVDFPPTWESLQQNVKKSSENMQMFEVDQGSQEYADAVKEFEESMNKWGYKFSIEKVQRIENRVEYTKHMALNESFKEKYQKRDVLVMRLFHGSKFASLQLIAVQGFNRNFAADANAAYYGKGVYFAVEAGYSAQDKYSVADSSGLRYMFVCRVIIGKYTKGTRNMKTAPPLSRGSREVYDTLCSSEADPKIFVAMTDAQAYPEYLITFKKIK